MTDPIVDEERALLTQVRAALSELPEARTASQAPLVRELERLRELMISGDEAKDTSALLEQYHHQSAVLDQLQRAGRPAQIDPDSPYFGHLRLREGDAVRDLCLGKSTCLAKGVRIVDWRDAPISRIFYRYAQGEDFDEEIAGRERIGEVLVRRMLRIRGGELERVQAPEGDFVLDPTCDGPPSREEGTAEAILYFGSNTKFLGFIEGDFMGTELNGAAFVEEIELSVLGTKQ